MKSVKKILWLTWKDRQNPASGGAEVVNEELGKRLAEAGYEVIFLVAGFSGAAQQESRDGFQIIRVGTNWTVYWHAYKYYKQHLIGWADLVIDEVNTVPFFARFYVKEPVVLFIHQLCRTIWFYQLGFPLNLIGYLAEPLYLRLLAQQQVVTISQSTADDLAHYGFERDRIRIISEGIEIEPVKDFSKVNKYEQPTVLSLGSIRPMKRTDEQVRAFEVAKSKLPNLQLKLAGSPVSLYGQQVLEMMKTSPYSDSIEYVGRVTEEQKMELMRRSHLILVTSVKEGWGLIVTEANSQGTPAVVYDVDGLRDSVKAQKTGVVVKERTPEAMGEAVARLLQDAKTYHSYQKAAWEWSRTITFKQSYDDFLAALKSFGF